MFLSYLKIAWRHLLQNKGLTFINVFGLATGMAFAILIGLWIKYETSFDQFHINKDRISFVYKNTFFNNERNTQEAVPLPLYYSLKSEYPEVKRATRMDWGSDYSLAVGDKKFNKVGNFVDPDFIEMFSFPVINGNKKTALNDLHSIVISESMATALFGAQDPIGKTIKVNNDFNVKVSAVIKNIPKNSTLQFDFLGPYDFVMETNKFIKDNRTNWGNNFLRIMVELKEGVSMDAFSKKIAPLNIERDKTLKDLTLFLHPMSKWHLKNDYKNWVNVGGKFEYVRLFGIVGIFVLLIACINFMNLSTARSEKRAREVGIRKAIGSMRKQLITQFMTETLLTAFLAFAVAVVMIPLLLPFLKDLGFENIQFDPSDFSLLFSLLGIVLVTGLIAGKDPNSQIAIDAIMTEWGYEKTIGLKFKQGRPFSREYKTDSNAVILNETALQTIGYKDPIGKTMKSADRVITIVGVVEDMLIQNPFKPVNPLVILFNSNESNNFIFLRLKAKAPLKPALAAIQPVFNKYNPAYTFDYNFSDKDFESKFEMENQVGKLAGIFAGLAIFISCLGLFGLAAFMAERRTKEIGIRKVLGASLINLWTLLSKEFVWLVLAGCFIASPLAFWLMHNWLQTYDYRINISWWIFAGAGFVAILIALLTVSTQAIKAAIANPVKSLRSE